MNSLSSIAQSGLGAAQRGLDAAANNIAKQQTPGHRRQFVLQESRPDGGVTTSVGQANVAGENLAKDIIQQTLASYSFKANLRVIQTHDELLGSLLDIRA